jgi:hypothetical protein
VVVLEVVAVEEAVGGAIRQNGALFKLEEKRDRAMQNEEN